MFDQIRISPLGRKQTSNSVPIYSLTMSAFVPFSPFGVRGYAGSILALHLVLPRVDFWVHK